MLHINNNIKYLPDPIKIENDTFILNNLNLYKNIFKIIETDTNIKTNEVEDLSIKICFCIKKYLENKEK